MTRFIVKQARDRVEVLRAAMLDPNPLEILAALPGLEEATRCLETMAGEAEKGVRNELRLLKNDLRRLAPLIDQGTEFCEVWAKMLGAGPVYTQAGVVSRQRLPGSGGTISLRG